MDKIIYVICLIIVISLFSCEKFKSQKNKNTYSLEIISSLLKEDTLSIVSTSDYLYYPFGKEKKPVDLETGEKVIFSKIGDDMYLYKNNCNILKLYLSEQTDLLEIVDGEINNADIYLDNYIHVNMSKAEFYSYFQFEYDKHPNIIEMESALEGIWHYYHFKNDTLRCIIIKSDYSF